MGMRLGNAQMARLHQETEAEYNNHNKPIQQGTVTPQMPSPVNSQPAEQIKWNEAISSLRKRDDDLSSRISSVQSTTRDLQIEVDANQQSYSDDKKYFFATLGQHSKAIRSLTDSNSNTKTQIQDLNTEILSLQGQITTLTDQVQTLSTWAKKPWYNCGQISATSQNSLHTLLTDLHKLSEP
jgi:chromosome segregation ATPase